MNFKVIWADQQKVIHRDKRDHVSFADLQAERPLIREKRLPLGVETTDSNNMTLIKSSKSGERRKRYLFGNTDGSVITKRKKFLMQSARDSEMFNDELWGQEWYLVSDLTFYSSRFSISSHMFYPSLFK